MVYDIIKRKPPQKQTTSSI